jgi:hypothetical protein
MSWLGFTKQKHLLKANITLLREKWQAQARQLNSIFWGLSTFYGLGQADGKNLDILQVGVG